MPLDDAIPEDDISTPAAPEPPPVEIPPWLILLVGRLTIQNEALRQQ